MKKFISVLCVVAIMLGISAPAMAVSAWTSELTSEFTVYDNFDGYSGGIAKHTIEGAAWSKSGDGVPVEGGKVTVSSATKATNTMVDLNTAITSDYAVIDFDFNITTANENNTALFYIKDSSNKDITRIQAQYKNGAMYLYTYKGGTESDKTTKVTLIASIDTSATYNLSVLYDFTNKTIDYYVNNELKYEDGGCYPNEITDIDKLFIQANYDNSTTTTIDISNVKIGALTDKLAMHYDSYYTAPTADDWSNLTSLTLPTTTKYGSAITWTSSDTKVIANEGTIDTLNALVTGSDVTLTGTYSKNGGTYTCTYDATVYGSVYDSSWTVCDFFNANSSTPIKNKISDTGDAVWSKSGYGAPTYSNGVLTVESSAVDNEDSGAASDTKAILTLADALSTKVSVAFDIKIAAAGNKPMIYFYGSDGTDIARIQGDSNGEVTKLYVYDGNNTRTVLVSTMVPDTWYTLKTVFDFETQKVDYYVDETKVYSDYSFFKENAASALGSVTIGATNKTGTIVNVRKFIIANSTPELGVDFSIDDYDLETKTITISNNTGSAKTAKLLFAGYNDRKFIDVVIEDVTLTQGENEFTAGKDFTASQTSKIMLWEDLESCKPLCDLYTFTAPRLFMMGDSIMTDWDNDILYAQPRYPQGGWGTSFKTKFISAFTVYNEAVSGFTAEYSYTNVWSSNNYYKNRIPGKEPVRDEVKAGDYVIISFIHNDFSIANKNSDAEYINTYKSYLKSFIDDCRAIGAHPILIVPPNRGETYNFHVNETVGDFSAVIPALAQEENVPYVDVHQWTMDETEKDANFLNTVFLTSAYLQGLVESGITTQAALNACSNENLHMKSNGSYGRDLTHISVDGCERIAEYVSTQLKGMSTGVEEYFK